jgi:hypothetical protein
MKKFIVLFLIIIFFPCLSVHGQPMPVIDSGLNALMTTSGVSQFIHFAQQVAHMAAEIDHFFVQAEHMTKQGQQAIQNLASAKDISSWDDFMDWYNRQLYLERKVGETFDNMNITIGKKQYHISDVENMAWGIKDELVDYWGKEFTPEQEREMWLALGLTPANYAYVEPFRAKAREQTKQGLTAAVIQSEWYQRNMERNKERQDKLAADKDKKDEDKMGSKEITMMILESLMEVNKVINDMVMNQAIEMEKNAVDDMLDKTPTVSPPPGDWAEDGFEKL